MGRGGVQHLCQDEGAHQQQAHGMKLGGGRYRHLVLAINQGPLHPRPAPQGVEPLPGSPCRLQALHTSVSAEFNMCPCN